MANINDIAKRAGVSVSTVSRVLNQHPYVSESKRAAVQRVIDEMDYTPNRSAVDLIRKETRSIGVIMPYNNNQAFDQLLHGVLNRSVERDYSVMVLPTKYDPEKELSCLNMLKINNWMESSLPLAQTLGMPLCHIPSTGRSSHASLRIILRLAVPTWIDMHLT